MNDKFHIKLYRCQTIKYYNKINMIIIDND